MKTSTLKLLQEMCIDITSITQKLGSDELRASACEIEGYLDVIADEYSKSGVCFQVEDLILKEFNLRQDSMANDIATQVLDSLRHSLNNFITGGLKDLYYFQENEVWHPKLVIDKAIDVTEINEYPDQIEVYRGCSRREFESKDFKQSWSITESSAREFAFIHYKDQPWFSINQRVVIKATIPKIGVYLTRLWHHEEEIVLNTALLSNVEVCT